MTELPPGGRGGFRQAITDQLLNIISEQAGYIETLELLVDELESGPTIGIRPPLSLVQEVQERLRAEGVLPEEPEDPRIQELRDLGVSDEEIERITALWDVEEEEDLDGPPIDWGDWGGVVNEVLGPPAAPKLVLTRPAETPALAVAPEPAKPRRPRKVNAPRAERARPGHRITPADDDDNPFKNGAIPGASAQAAVILNQPLKTTRPRQRSQHDTGSVQQWKKDGAGRRVPIETPEDDS